jgi:hypothetical protein
MEHNHIDTTKGFSPLQPPRRLGLERCVVPDAPGVADHGSLQIARRVEVGQVGVEISLIDRFADASRALPYANLRRGARADTS